MKEQAAKSLKDGEYSCNATLHIEDGKAVIILHSTFGLLPGTAIPLYRTDGNLIVEKVTGSEVAFLNGHSII